jgi:ribonuclease HII
MGYICGIDEVGRGPLAGPVVACSVLLPESFPIEILKDSKKLSQSSRESIEHVILSSAAVFGIGWVSHREIDRINIHNAALRAMQLAFDSMIASFRSGDITDIESRIDRAYVDGKFTPHLPVRTEAVIRGDSLVPEIMAASILAKNARDRWMIRYGRKEPRYLFEKHKGYPTSEHRRLLDEHGPSRIHRSTFGVSRDP